MAEPQRERHFPPNAVHVIRTAQQINVMLSQMADQKANILLAATFVIFTIAIGQARADLTTQAAEFVRTLRSAEEMEKRAQVGAALAWFLKAQKIYPASDFAQQGIDRMKKAIFPEG